MRPISVQLYSVRDHLDRDADATLERLARGGYELAEPFGLDQVDDARIRSLQRASLSYPTAHAQYLGRADARRTFERAANLGVEVLFEPGIAPTVWTEGDGPARVADMFAEVMDLASDAGVALGYHNHGHEVEIDDQGRTRLEVFASLVDSKVTLEVDTYWAAVGGTDPVSLLPVLGDRVTAIHVKDGAVSHDDDDQVPVGEGAMPIREILAAAQSPLWVVELDGGRLDSIDAVLRSLVNLRAMGAA